MWFVRLSRAVLSRCIDLKALHQLPRRSNNQIYQIETRSRFYTDKQQVVSARVRRWLVRAIGCVISGGLAFKLYQVQDGRWFMVKASEENHNVNAATRQSLTLTDAVAISRDLCQRIKDETGSPGLSVAVSVNGQILWTEGLGFADVENRLPCKPETIFRIASISKSITMTKVAKLWESGSLDLDKPVQYYVPDFPEKTYNGHKVLLTTRQLVSHLSGIRHYYKDYSKYKLDKTYSLDTQQSGDNSKSSCIQQQDSGEDLHRSQQSDSNAESTPCVQSSQAKPKSKTESEDEMMLSEYYIKENYSSVKESLTIFKDDPLVFNPGSNFLYTSHGWTLVSAVIEGAAKMPFEKCMKQQFHELGMDNTFLEENRPLIYNRGRHYVKNKRGRLENAPFVDLSYKWAGGGFISNVIDLVKFGNIMLYSHQAPDMDDARVKTVKNSSTGDTRGNKQQYLHSRKESNKDSAATQRYTAKSNAQSKELDMYQPKVSQSKDDLAGYLQPKTMEMIWKPVENTKMSWELDGSYAMGWGVCESKQEHGLCKQQRYYISHTGGAIGASSVLLILPSLHNPNLPTGNSPKQKNYKSLPEGVVVTIIVNMMSVGLNKTALEIAKTFEKIDIKDIANLDMSAQFSSSEA